jgi:DNA-binding IclR family transcriptional regulator
MDDDTPTKRSVKTAERTFRIIDLLGDIESASLTTIAEHLDMPRSTLHTYLSTLLEQQYLRKEGDEYRLSLKFLDYGVKVQQNELIYRMSEPFLEQLARETKEIAWLVVEEHGRAVCLRKAEGERAIQPYKRVGARLTMHAIASGKALLAELSDERIREILDQYGMPKRTEKTITDPEELFAEIEEIRETGVAFNDCESMEGFRAVASAISTDGELHGSIVVSGPANRFQGDRFRTELPEILTGTTNALELELVSSER